MGQLREWAELNGHEVLPSQADDPEDQVEVELHGDLGDAVNRILWSRGVLENGIELDGKAERL